jgi:hypothetical protein
MGMFVHRRVPDACPAHPFAERSTLAAVAFGTANKALWVGKGPRRPCAAIPMVPFRRIKMRADAVCKGGGVSLPRETGPDPAILTPIRKGIGGVKRLVRGRGRDAQV